MTQWIFRVETCKCSHPALLFNIDQSESVASMPTEVREYVQDAAEDPIEVDVDKFPIDRYDAFEILGQGQAGIVYRAKDRLLRRPVAIKTVRALQLTGDQIIQFQREAKATSQLEHRNLIRLYDFGITDGGVPYLVMEYFKGQSLSDFIDREGALPLKTVLALMIEICRGMEHAHQRGILHRDLKSSNVLLVAPNESEQFWTVKIIDFGLAALPPTSVDGYKTKEGIMLGSPAYMSPEQARGTRDIDERSDTYSLGCVLFECITGSVPFEGQTALATMMSQIESAPPTILDVKPGAERAEELSALVSKALMKAPEKRFQSMTEFKEALKSLLIDVEQQEELFDRPQVQAENFQAVVTTAVPERQDRSRKAKLVLTAACIGFVVLAGVILSIGRINTDNQKRKVQPITSALDDEHVGLFKLPPVTGVTDIATESPQERKISKKLAARDELVQSDPLETVLPTQEPLFLEGTKLKSRLHLNDNDVKFLQDKKQFPFIDSANFRGTNLSGEGLKYLLGRPIYELDVSSTPLNLKAIKYISEMKDLRSLSINHLELTADSVKPITKLKNLTSLSLVGTTLDDEGVRNATEGLDKLVSVELSFNPEVTNACLPALQKLPTLTTLGLKKCGITGDGVAEFEKFPALQAVFLDHTKWNDEQLVQLIDILSKKNTTHFGINVADVSEETVLKNLPRLKHLVAVGISNSKKFSAKTKVALKRAMPSTIFGFD